MPPRNMENDEDLVPSKQNDEYEDDNSYSNNRSAPPPSVFQNRLSGYELVLDASYPTAAQKMLNSEISRISLFTVEQQKMIGASIPGMLMEYLFENKTTQDLKLRPRNHDPTCPCRACYEPAQFAQELRGLLTCMAFEEKNGNLADNLRNGKKSKTIGLDVGEGIANRRNDNTVKGVFNYEEFWEFRANPTFMETNIKKRIVEEVLPIILLVFLYKMKTIENIPTIPQGHDIYKCHCSGCFSFAYFQFEYGLRYLYKFEHVERGRVWARRIKKAFLEHLERKARNRG